MMMRTLSSYDRSWSVLVLRSFATGPTHQQGGTIDAVTSRSVGGCLTTINVEDVGFSDHYLHQWSETTTTPPRQFDHGNLWIFIYRSAVATNACSVTRSMKLSYVEPG